MRTRLQTEAVAKKSRMNIRTKFSMKNCGAIVLLILTGFVSAQSRGSDPPALKVDAAVTGLMREQKIPGDSLAVVRDGKAIKATGYGLANVELNVPVTPQSIFQSGSVAKQFTATGVMMLVEEGKVGLDDSITEYFPEAPPAWKAVTIRHILTHTSGIPDIFGETEADEYTKGILDFRRDYSEEEMVRRIRRAVVGFSARRKMELQQYRVHAARSHDSPDNRAVLGRFPATAHLPPAGHDVHQSHERRRHRSQPQQRISHHQWRTEEPGMGSRLHSIRPRMVVSIPTSSTWLSGTQRCTPRSS